MRVKIFFFYMWVLHCFSLALKQICGTITLKFDVELNINLPLKAYEAEHIYIELTCDQKSEFKGSKNQSRGSDCLVWFGLSLAVWI